MRCSRATAEILAAGPTRIGTMMPASAASIGPRSEPSSQGWATTVVAGGTCLALAISRSYFECGGLATGPTAAIVPISLSFSVSMTTSPYPSCAPVVPLRCLPKGGPAGASCCIDAEQPGDLAQSRPVLRRHFPARGHHLLDEVECLAPQLFIGRKHRRQRRKRGLLIDQQHVELLAHERLEVGQWQVAVGLADAPDRLEAALVDRGPRHADVEQRADHGFAQAADRDARLEVGDPALQQLAVQGALCGLPQRLRRGRVD